MRTRLKGRVVTERVDVGSKSERDAALLLTEEGSYVLRVAGGHSFGDPRVDALVGQTIVADGNLHEQYFDMSKWVVEDDPSSEREAAEC